MKVLVVDVGGTHVKILATGKRVRREFPSGPTMTPDQMVAGVLQLSRDWKFDVVSIGYPGLALHGKPVAEPHNLARGWVGFDFEVAFQRPVKLMNDAAMQALGSYKGGRLLFLGLGTGLGSAFIVDGIVEPMELAHLPYKKATFEDYVGVRGLEKHGLKKWRREVEDVVARLTAALEPDEVAIGGGNAKKLKGPPPGARLVDNACAFQGGLRMWNNVDDGQPLRRPKAHRSIPMKRKEHARGKAHRTAHRTAHRQKAGLENTRSPQ
jgi:polyphosphate glucokinase